VEFGAFSSVVHSTPSFFSFLQRGVDITADVLDPTSNRDVIAESSFAATSLRFVHRCSRELLS
jgi:hypothetical protein